MAHPGPGFTGVAMTTTLDEPISATIVCRVFLYLQFFLTRTGLSIPAGKLRHFLQINISLHPPLRHTDHLSTHRIHDTKYSAKRLLETGK